MVVNNGGEVRQKEEFEEEADENFTML